MRDKKTGQQVVLKFLERGEGIDNNVEREIVNMRTMRHPNIIRFYEVLLTPTHLCIVMEYAAGGELFEHIVKKPLSFLLAHRWLLPVSFKVDIPFAVPQYVYDPAVPY